GSSTAASGLRGSVTVSLLATFRNSGCWLPRGFCRGRSWRLGRSRRVWVLRHQRWHQGLGLLGRPVTPHFHGTARPSPLTMAPTSLPFARSVPQSLFQLHADVPCVPSRHEHLTYSNSSPPARTSSRSRFVALAPSSVSA